MLSDRNFAIILVLFEVISIFILLFVSEIIGAVLITSGSMILFIFAMVIDDIYD